MDHLAFIGLGAMGARMARRLLALGPVTVHNRTPAPAEPLLAAGARWAASPRAAAAGADVVFTMVTDDEAAAAVWLDPERGAVAGLRPGTLAIECSTVTPAFMARLAPAVEARGAVLLGAPVAGSTPQAEAGQLAVLAGGSDAAIDRARPLLGALGSAVLVAGPAPADAAVFKLLVNALFASQVAVLADLLRGAATAGLAPAHVVALLTRMPVTSPAAAAAAGLMLAGDHAPRFPVDLVIKDLRYASALGPQPVVDAARARFEDAAARGLGGANLTVVHQVPAREG